MLKEQIEIQLLNNADYVELQIGGNNWLNSNPHEIRCTI